MRKIILLLTSFVAFISGTTHALSVLDVSPESHSLTSSQNTDIVVHFDEAIDPATANASTISVFGRWSGVSKVTISLNDDGTQITLTPNNPFFAGETVMASVSKGIKSINGNAMDHAYAWQFWIRPVPGSIELEEITRISVREPGEGHIQTYGANAADLNNDGFSDYFVPNEISNDCRVFMNDGMGNYSDFTIYPIPGGARPSTNENADFNGDSFLDIAVGNSAGDSITIFMGDGSGGFLSITNYQAAQGVRGLSISDMDGDGDADIVTANRSANNLTVFHNNGDGTFATRIIVEATGTSETASATADANDDGIPDLFVGCFSSDDIVLLLGDGDGGFVFSDKVSTGGQGPWMIASGDVNGDGHVDIVSANAQSNNASVILGDGTGNLSPATTYTAGAFPIAIDLGDIDGDGDLDMMTSNYSSANWTYWENDGEGNFINQRILDAEVAGSCATFHDRDNDGDLDVTGIDEEADLIILFQNAGPSALNDYRGGISISAYPNPSIDRWTVRSTASSVILQLCDLQGRLLDSVETEDGIATISATTLQPGMYLLRACDRDGIIISLERLVLIN